MNKLLALSCATMLSIAAANAMNGAPVFCVGEKMTSMTVEGTQTAMKLNSSVSGGSESFMSRRMMLTARFGLLSNADLSVQLGASNLSFQELPAGYSEFAADWALAWGFGVRVGLPEKVTQYQVLAAINYFGFQPSGRTSNGTKNISSSYSWHEISPAVTAGYIVGPVVPYVGLTKPFLFGTKKSEVAFNGQAYPAAGGRTTYTDGDQALRGILGIEWRWPDGYSLTAEGAASGSGLWTFSIGISQVLK